MSLYPRKISGITRTETILMARTSRGAKIVLLIIPITLRAARRLLTIMEISLRISKERSLLSAGNAMAHTMLQFAQIGRSQTVTFIQYKMK